MPSVRDILSCAHRTAPIKKKINFPPVMSITSLCRFPSSPEGATREKTLAVGPTYPCREKHGRLLKTTGRSEAWKEPGKRKRRSCWPNGSTIYGKPPKSTSTKGSFTTGVADMTHCPFDTLNVDPRSTPGEHRTDFLVSFQNDRRTEGNAQERVTVPFLA